MQQLSHFIVKRWRLTLSGVLSVFMLSLGTLSVFAAEDTTRHSSISDQLVPMLIGGSAMALIMIFLVWLTLRQGRKDAS